MRLLAVSTLVILATSIDLRATDRSPSVFDHPTTTATDAPDVEPAQVRAPRAQTNALVAGSIFDATFDLLLKPAADA